MLGRRLQLLVHHPSFRWYAISCLLSTFGGGLSYVVMSWLILQADNSVSAVAILMLSFWVPMVLFGPLLGVVADRYSRKWIMIFSNGLRAIILIAFGIYLHYHLSATLIYALMAMLGVCFTVYLPAAIALIREIIEPEDLLYGNSTIDIAYETGNVLGMGSAGLIIAISSASTAILINGIIFIFCTFALFMVRIKVQKTKERSNEPITVQLINDFKLGLNYLGNNSKLLIIYCVQILILVGFMTSPVLLVPFAKNILHTNVSEFGQIDAALSVGVVTGGICIPWIAKRFGFVRSIVAMCLVLALCFSLFSINRDILIAGILYFCLGFGLSVWPLIVTQAQNVTHIDFQARVQSVFNSISGLLVLIMYLLVSLTSHFVSISYYYAFNVVFSLLAAFLLWYYRARFNSDALDNALSSKNN
ncbi:MFS transporter [Candidiatus Paracoxiella cheracis]|uniref:MFS transporter n=1 Tax=Candidiatus Paracoxiella cheracis TaxID=3405120 RepID=UPI003BF564A9